MKDMNKDPYAGYVAPDDRVHGHTEIGVASQKETIQSAYCPRGEGPGHGWVRVGRFDAARRRALWIRLIDHDPNVTFERPMKGDPNITVITSGQCGAIELCSGREGDDAFFSFERSRFTPEEWNTLYDLFSRAMCHIPDAFEHMMNAPGYHESENEYG